MFLPAVPFFHSKAAPTSSYLFPLQPHAGSRGPLLKACIRPPDLELPGPFSILLLEALPLIIPDRGPGTLLPPVSVLSLVPGSACALRSTALVWLRSLLALLSSHCSVTPVPVRPCSWAPCRDSQAFPDSRRMARQKCSSQAKCLGGDLLGSVQSLWTQARA